MKAPDDPALFALMFGIRAEDYLFIRFSSTMYIPLFSISALPGHKEGVSGSIIIPNNIAINKYITEERKKASAEFLKFVASKEVQKKYIIPNYFSTANMELYNDEDVCGMTNCDLIKDIYPFSVVTADEKTFGDDLYHVKYRNLMFEYLYNDKPLDEVLKKIDDITRIYKFSLDTEDSKTGLILFIIFVIFFIFTILTSILLFINKFERAFKFLPTNLWIITILGTLILMSSVITLYGDVTNVSCHLRTTLINMGFILSICPSLLTLAKNFPIANKYSEYIEYNQYTSILIVMIFTGILNELIYFIY